MYKITQVTHWNNIELNIVVGCFKTTEEEIESKANKELKAVLKEDGLHVIYGEDYFFVLDNDNDKYHFKICTKELPPSIDPRNLTKDEKNELLDDERYMINAYDLKVVDWNLSKVYKTLKQVHPEKEVFSFSSLAYSIEKIHVMN